MKTTVIFHAADYDGIFCREIAKRFLPDAEVIGWDFGDPLLSPGADKIYILDLSPDCLIPEDRLSWGKIVWIDHHKTSIEKYGNTIPGYRIDGVAACRLAWQWFTMPCKPAMHLEWLEKNPLPTKQDFIGRTVSEPLAVRLAGEYDIWDKRDPDAEVFQFGLRSRELTQTDWGMMLGSECYEGCQRSDLVDSLLRDGRLLQSYQQRNDASLMKFQSWITEWEGLKFLTVNTNRFNSLTFATKDVPETGHDALLGFSFDGRKFKVSLYHARHNMGIDLSEIAKKYGGGGHRGACGFVCDKLPFMA